MHIPLRTDQRSHTQANKTQITTNIQHSVARKNRPVNYLRDLGVEVANKSLGASNVILRWNKSASTLDARNCVISARRIYPAEEC